MFPLNSSHFPLPMECSVPAVVVALGTVKDAAAREG